MRPLNRPVPLLPAAAMKTYQLVAPPATHFRSATCAEAGCGAHQHGWKTSVDETSELGQRQAYYIRRVSGRRFREERHPEGLTSFVFEPGQRCFQQHQVTLEREPLYVVRDGDWRGNPRRTGPRRHARPEDWVDDFATHQDQLNRAIERG